MTATASIIPAGTIALLATVAAAIWGGWPFALISFPLLLVLVRSRFDFESVAFAAAPGLVWLFVLAFTGDRRCYFPYTLQYAIVLAATPLEETLAGRFAAFAMVVIIFLLFRSSQDASMHVLLVELTVAAVVGAITVTLHGAESRPSMLRLALASLASVLAYIGLSF